MSLKPLKINTLNKIKNFTSINNDKNLSYQELIKSINSAKNTSINLIHKDKKENFDIGTISRGLSVSILINLAKEHLNPLDKKNRIIISDEINKWKNQEKITFPSSVINKIIDRVCMKNKSRITTEEKKEIFKAISEEYKIKTDINSAQSSIVQMLLNDKEITKKIDSLEIGKKDRDKDIEHENVKISEIKGVFYNKIAKAVYNTLFCNDKNHPINFADLSDDVRKLTEEIINKKNET